MSGQGDFGDLGLFARPVHKTSLLSHTDLKIHINWGRWNWERFFLNEASCLESWGSHRGSLGDGFIS